ASNFLVFFLKENDYSERVADIALAAERVRKKICYVCLSNTYDNAERLIVSRGIDAKKFCFIDTLSSYYGKEEPVENCFFVTSPYSLSEIKEAISCAINERGCRILIFDSITSILEYKDIFDVLRFTHELLTENIYKKAKKVYLISAGNSIPEEETSRLISDITMFADMVLEIPKSFS
ncbi:MAG: hypothetical protein QW286_00425, partial [Candidatus Aenigmatarchaeota archaeon]